MHFVEHYEQDENEQHEDNGNIIELVEVENTNGASSSSSLEHELQSKAAKSLYFILGMSQPVREYDKHHVLFKNFKYEKSLAICSNIIKRFTPDIVSVCEETSVLVKQWEKDFFIAHGKSATTEDLQADFEAHTMYKKWQHSKSLMKLWNIS